MKYSKTMVVFLALSLLAGNHLLADGIQYRRPANQTGLNIFESPKKNDVKFDGLFVEIGLAASIQYQGLSNSTGSDSVEITKLENNFNLPTANLNITAQLADGLKMSMVTYLSSQHHNEAYVKDGYFQIDKLDFIAPGFMSNIMDKVTIKVGHMENNYGDTHFRRSDNARAFYNPFVGNYILDAFTTEVGGEVLYQNNGMLAMVGLTNARLNQNVHSPEKDNYAKLLKLGFDKQMSTDLRLRLTGSVYTNDLASRIYLYGGDRAGSRYYEVMNGNFTAGRFNPGFQKHVTAIMVNPFIKYKGLEIFSVYESVTGGSNPNYYGKDRTWNQTALEVINRFGKNDRFYFGGRFNTASGIMETQPGRSGNTYYNNGDKLTITRMNIGGGWFLAPNVLAKLEYVNQTYKNFPDWSPEHEGNFGGFVFESAILF